MSCERKEDWVPASAQEVQTWQEHVDCYTHLWNIVISPYTSSELLIEIIKGASFRNYFAFRDMLWSNPNLDDKILGWLDVETANWSVEESLQYWQMRASLKASDSSPDKNPRTGAPMKSFFAAEMLSKEMEDSECSLEVIRISQPLAQQLWHDLAQQEVAYLQYQEDSVSGSTFRAYMSDHELDVPEGVLDALSYGYFTDWISTESEIDEDRASGDILSRIEEDGFREREDSVQDHTLCKALVYGNELGDLGITGDLQKYLAESGLFGESDFDYPVKVDSEPGWEGPRFRDLTSDQQLSLVKNICRAMSHSLLGRQRGIARHLLVCIVLHSATSPDVLKYLKGENMGEEVAQAIEYADAD